MAKKKSTKINSESVSPTTQIDEFEHLLAFEEITDHVIVKKQNTQIPKKKNKAKKAPAIKCAEIGSLQKKLADETRVDQIIKNWASYSLPDCLMKAIVEVGYEMPTEIQQKTLNVAIQGRRDIVGAAETGSGKTVAFGLPVLCGILKSKEKMAPKNSTDKKQLYALILTPTRELAVQIKNNLKSIARYSGIRVEAIFGGLALVKQERILSQCPEVIIATPGRLWELMQSNHEHLANMSSLRFLVIDETDRMLEKDHFAELHQILEVINANEEECEKRQNFVFSATLTMIHDLPRYLLAKKKLHKKQVSKMTVDQKLQQIMASLQMSNVKIIDTTQETKGISKSLSEWKLFCELHEKDIYVYYFLIEHPGRTLIFCNSIGCVKRLHSLLALLSFTALPLHASMHQKHRLKNLETFRDNEKSVLIATDVAARGLDIPNVKHVIHYQTPRTSESYVHRSGRTARLAKQGSALILIEPNETQLFFKLCEHLDKEIPNLQVEHKTLKLVKEHVRKAQELDKLELKLKKSTMESNWLKRAAQEMDIIVDDEENLMQNPMSDSELKKLKKSIAILRAQLQTK